MSDRPRKMKEEYKFPAELCLPRKKTAEEVVIHPTLLGTLNGGFKRGDFGVIPAPHPDARHKSSIVLNRLSLLLDTGRITLEQFNQALEAQIADMPTFGMEAEIDQETIGKFLKQINQPAPELDDDKEK